MRDGNRIFSLILSVSAKPIVPGRGICYETGMKRRYWIGLALGLLAAVPPTGRSADAVVEFYRTQPDAEQYLLHETSLYELQRSIDDKFGRDRDFWRRAAEKFAENAEAVRLCGERERNYEMWQEREGKWLEEDVGSRMEAGDRVFHYEFRNGGKGEESGRLILAPDGSIKWREREESTTWRFPELQAFVDARWQQKTETVRRTIGERATELEADAAALFLDKRSDAAGHSLHATSVRGLEFYLNQVGYAMSPDKWIVQHFADVPSFLEFAEAEKSVLQAWLTPRKAIVEQIEAEAAPTDRLYWDVFDDGEHCRAGLLWLRWDGSVRQEWPDFGEGNRPE